MKVVLLAGRGTTSYAVARALRQSFDLRAVICEDPPSRVHLLKRRAKKLGWPVVLNQIAFQTLGVACLRLSARKRLREILNSEEFSATSFGETKVHSVHSINDLDVPSLVRSYSPDVVVVNGTRIISQEILKQIDVPLINTHLGITPMYRGVHGGYWALADGRADLFGATVHRVDAGIDTGAILAQVRADPSPDDNFTTYPLVQLRAALPALMETVRRGGSAVTDPIVEASTESRLRYHPSLTGYLFRKLRLGAT